MVSDPIPPNAERPSRPELAALPEDVVGEILDGDLVVTPRHDAACARVTQVLGQALRGSGSTPDPFLHGFWVFAASTLRLGPHLVVPDLAGWRRQRMPKRADRPPTGLVPDWVCEIISPTTALMDRTRKLRIYASFGVCWAWLLDPQYRTIEVMWLEGDEWVLVGNFGGNQHLPIPPFHSLNLDLTALWEAAPVPPAP